jgi:GT2 family glycosyltransferase
LSAVSTIVVKPTLQGRPAVRGRFVFEGERTLWIRGVTYGPFRPDADSREYPAGDRLERDLAAIAASGFNTIRTYTTPPGDLLDSAWRHGLRVLVGLSWEQHVAFVDDPGRADAIAERVRASVRACAEHPAVLAYAVGNEIPASIVRWHGAAAIERFLARLAGVVRAEDPGALVTYVNYPTTEYLDLPFVDLVCFNVYLEDPASLTAYLARLHNLAGDRPLVLAEIGLDSRRNGVQEQARSLEGQVRTAFTSGCAGAFVFAWTDEWHRGGFDVDDWDVGLTDRERRPKPALGAVRAAFAAAPFGPRRAWPRVSVVVCSYNGARTIRDCLDGLRKLAYPDYEVIVVDDGSTDATAAIAREYPVRLISTRNRGLSNARNTGLDAATGEIVAYIDDDAWPDPYWLHYLVAALEADDHHGGVGGPNLPPPGDGWIAECVAHAPGGPAHVLVDDREAEHVPGCNMAFRKRALQAIGGFDPRFRSAGDDVDVCWRIRDAGFSLRFSPSAVVWHHRRNSVRAYWRQQLGYGRAEAMLEQKWPERYNAAGHAAWAGQIYGAGATLAARLRGRVYHGTWGTAPFQSVYAPAPGLLAALPLMPEWYLLVAALVLLSGLGAFWPPVLVFALPALLVAIGAPVLQAVRAALRPPLREPAPAGRAWQRAVLTGLHLAQPAARLKGRLSHGLTPWRRRGLQAAVFPYPRSFVLWTERWHDPAGVVARIEATLRSAGFVVARGGDFDRWDLEVRGGLLGRARVLTATEEHGSGRQLRRLRVWPRFSFAGVLALAPLATLAAAAAGARASTVAALLGAVVLAVAVRALFEAGRAMAALLFARQAVARELHAVPERAARAMPPQIRRAARGAIDIRSA